MSGEPRTEPSGRARLRTPATITVKAIAEVPTAIVTRERQPHGRERHRRGAASRELLAPRDIRVSARDRADEPERDPRAVLRALAAQDGVRAVIATGGTGVSPRDVTPDTLEPCSSAWWRASASCSASLS